MIVSLNLTSMDRVMRQLFICQITQTAHLQQKFPIPPPSPLSKSCTHAQALNPKPDRRKCASNRTGKEAPKGSGARDRAGLLITSAENPRASRSTTLSRPEGPLARSTDGACGRGDLGVGGQEAVAMLAQWEALV